MRRGNGIRVNRDVVSVVVGLTVTKLLSDSLYEKLVINIVTAKLLGMNADILLWCGRYGEGYTYLKFLSFGVEGIVDIDLSSIQSTLFARTS